MQDTWTTSDLADILGKSERWVQMLANEEGWPHIEEPVNGAVGWRFQVLDLPAEVQEAVRRYSLGLDSETVEEMARRAEIHVEPGQANDPAKASKIRMVCECLAVPQGARGRDARIREIAEGHGYDRATAYRLMGRAKKGLPLFVSTRNYGHRFEGLGITVRAWDPEAARLAIEAIVGNRHNRAELLSLYNRIAEEAGRLTLRVGTYSSFCQLARRVNPALIKYRDTGHRGLREDIIPAIRRDFSAYRAMECLIGDQHKADYYCLDAAGQIVTLELFVWLDFRTQLAWGSIAYKHYNRYTVGSALLQAVRCGIPSTLYTDWGKPEESHYMTHLVAQLTGIGCKAEPIRRVNATVRNPQAKPIEGWFGHLDAKLRNIGLPGYSKRLADTRENELHQKQVREQIRAGELLGIHEVTERVFGVIEEWNSHPFKNRGEDSGKSPRQVYTEETAKHPVTTLSDDVLSYIFLPLQPATVKRSQVRIKHPWLRSLLYYSPELAGHGGEGVEVRFDPFDQSRVWVFRTRNAERGTGNGELICVAEEWGMINPKVSDQVAAKIGAQRALEKQVRELHTQYKPSGAGSGRDGARPSTVRRIHPDERQARELVRVMRTPLDEQEEVGSKQHAVGSEKRGYRPLVFSREEVPRERLRPFDLSITTHEITEE